MSRSKDYKIEEEKPKERPWTLSQEELQLVVEEFRLVYLEEDPVVSTRLQMAGAEPKINATDINLDDSDEIRLEFKAGDDVHMSGEVHGDGASGYKS